MIHGEQLQIAIGGTPLAASKTCNVSKSQSFIEVAAPTAGRWEAFVPQKLGWGITSDCLLATLASYKTLDAAWKAGTALTIRFYDTEFDENETGTAYIEKLDLVCTKGNLAKMSISLKGSGALADYAGTAVSISRSLQHVGKFYYASSGGTYIVALYSSSAKIYTGSFTLSKRTLVQISGMRTGNNILVFLSTNNGIITKAQNAETIYSSDYSALVNTSGKVWLNSGTWYLVESSQDYSEPTYKAISL